MTDLAVIIVSYNVRELLAQALRSLLASLAKVGAVREPPLHARVIVVENDSHDGSAEMVRTQFPDVELLEPGQNLGFAGGNNLALRHLGFGKEQHVGAIPSACPEFVWLLNCDTEVIGDAPLQLVNYLRRNPSVGAIGPKLRYGDQTFQHSAFAFPGLFQLFLDLFPAPGRLLESRINGRYPPHLWQGKRAFAVDMLLGAALMVRGAAIEQVGLMDEGYFMYAEELDWCRALRHAGWLIHALPTAIVIHYSGQSTKQFRDRMFVALWRSRLRYYEKWESPTYVRLVRFVLRLGMAWQSRQARSENKNNDENARRLAAYQEVAAL